WSVPLLLLALAGCSKKDSPQPPNSSPQAKPLSHQANAASPGNYFKTHFQDESQYIMETIVSDLAEMAYYSSHKSVPVPGEFSVEAKEIPGKASGDPVYEIEIALGKEQPPIQTRLEVNLPIWAPELYDRLTKAIFDAAGVAKGAGTT